MTSIADILRAAPVIPVIVIESTHDALPLANALLRGGLRVLEVTLRTPDALQAIREMSTLEGAIVGAGTVLDLEQYSLAVQAGARFVVSPGLTDSLAHAAETQRVPLLPGTATASEVMRARDAGFRHLKFFPAETSGGVAALKSFASVFRDIVFCPTGGITERSAPDYLALANVACVGGSWVMPGEAVRAREWLTVERLARAAAALRPSRS